MELLYILLEDVERLGLHKEVCFDSQFNVKINKYSLDQRTISIEIEKNKYYPVSLFSSNISTISAIIGENGTGKTSFFEFLRRFLTNNSYIGEKWLAIFKHDNKFIAYHTLFDYKEPISDKGKFYENLWYVKILFENIPIKINPLLPWGIDKLSPRQNDILLLKLSKVIYYSGIFDLKGYPYIDSNEYIDISTNFLIEHDANFDQFSMPDKSILLKHKHRNILRQIQLVEMNNQLLESIDFNTPTSISVIFERVNLDPDKSRDLNSSSIEIFNYFNNRLTKIEYQKVNEFINKYRDSDINKYRSALIYKCKLRFIDSILFNFFKNIDHGEFLFLDLGIKHIMRFDTLEIFDAVIAFFNEQKFIKKVNCENLIRKAYEIIEASENTIIEDHEGNVVDVKNKISIIELLSLYENYLASFPYHTIYGFISVDWRDISSGEKAFLDLFARLLYAKNLIKNKVKSLIPNQRPKHIPVVYILLDEAEIGFHPEWQRKYLFKIEKFLSYLFLEGEGELFYNSKIQIIITSHSPFLISDLPRSNIIFLEKNNNELFHISNFGREETFGANIINLFSNSFFMQNGLIGEFAKEKIFSLLSEIEQKDEILQEEYDELKFRIDIIGEPLIKEKLSNLLSEKFLLNDIMKKKDFHQAELNKIDKILKKRKNEKNR